MNTTRLKAKLLARQLTIGSWITLGHPAIAEIMAQAGFDWLVVDMEHSVISIAEAEVLIRTISMAGVSPLVRLTSNDANQIKRVMDAGSHGIIVPMVNSRCDAEAAVAAVYYPPRGKRGVGLARAQGYGASFEPYRSWLENEAVVIVQVEHVDAVNNLEEILSVEGVDGFIIGPYDLSASMGAPGDFQHPDMKKALARIKEVSKSLHKPGGLHVVEPDVDKIANCIAEGYSFLAYSLDIRLLDTGCRQGLKALNALIKEGEV